MAYFHYHHYVFLPPLHGEMGCSGNQTEQGSGIRFMFLGASEALSLCMHTYLPVAVFCLAVSNQKYDIQGPSQQLRRGHVR